ncbi:mesoderm posterior protein 1-like [Oncorhynchus clarkii lewisi]|uniref:mesoderm posterior protein 1-like n=1 Tax=Oncorhynchus clarkii lewisi TaxID=490388 RepID=UPI0039B83F61
MSGRLKVLVAWGADRTGASSVSSCNSEVPKATTGPLASPPQSHWPLSPRPGALLFTSPQAKLFSSVLPLNTQDRTQTDSMDMSAPLLSNYGVGVQYHWSYPSSDSEFYNVSSPETCILSPSAYMDFSSSCLPRGTATEPHRSTHSGGAKASASPSSSDEGGPSGGRIRKNRSKNPSKQRQSASEKEKLRMRDLTKALNHLRTYLPPSVAPAGQTLTKIETLRLTIGYISHLSAQLELSEEAVCQRKELNLPVSGHHVSPQQDSVGLCQFNTSSSGYCWATPTYPLHNTGMERYPLSSEMDTCAYDNSFNSSMDSLLESPEYAEAAQSCQIYRKDVHYQNIPQDFWM